MRRVAARQALAAPTHRTYIDYVVAPYVDSDGRYLTNQEHGTSDGDRTPWQTFEDDNQQQNQLTLLVERIVAC